MSLRLTAIALLAAPLLGALSACQAPPPRAAGGGGGGASGAADAAVVAACRQQAEDVYSAQNRSARLQSSTRDSPFSASPAPVAATGGLSDRYAMDAMVGDCIRNASRRPAGPDLSPTPVAAPVAAARPASRLPSGPAGGPPASSATSSPGGTPLDRAPPPPAPVRP